MTLASLLKLKAAPVTHLFTLAAIFCSLGDVEMAETANTNDPEGLIHYNVGLESPV